VPGDPAPLGAPGMHISTGGAHKQYCNEDRRDADRANWCTHCLAREVFHGRRGELRQRYRKGPENQRGALGLIVNVLVLWNTVSMQAALDQLRAEGHDVRPDDVARLSPLGYKHINFLGRYSFNLAESVANGKRHPLRAPGDLRHLIA
jgi:hypothetical protein